MTRPIEESIARWDRWIDAIQRERDGHAQLLGDARSSDIQRAFSSARLVILESEIADAHIKVAELAAQRSHPAMLFRHRPKPMLKIAPVRARKRTA